MVISCASNAAAGLGEAAVPGAAQIVQDERGGTDRRDLLRRREILRSPGQDRRRPVGRVVTQPGLCRPHDPPGHFACPAAREAAGNPSRGSRNPAAQFRGQRLLRQIEEGGQRRRLDQRWPGLPIAGRREPRAAHRRSAGRKRGPSWSCRDRCRWKSGLPSPRGGVARAGAGAIPCGPGTQSSISGRSWCASSRVRACRVP